MLSETSSFEANVPEIGDLVIATVERITNYGGYITLDEYGDIAGLLHISEIASGWVKNIRDVIREKQKLVLKVLRVDSAKRQVDLSLRRVSGKEKQNKLLQWKRQRRAVSIIENVVKDLNLDSSVSIRIIDTLEEKFGDVYQGLEEMVEKSDEAFEKTGLPKEWFTPLLESIKQKVKLPTVKIKGIAELTCRAPDGVNTIKKVLTEAKSTRRTKRIKVDIYCIGAPKYMIEVTAREYRSAEKTINDIVNRIVEDISKNGGHGKFMRTQ